MKYTVYKEHHLRLDELEVQLRNLKEEHTHTRVKVESIENSLPKLVREMLDYYAEQKLNPIFETFVKKTALKDQMALKMDTALFHEYVKKQQQAEAVNDKEMRTDERLFSLEQGVRRALTREEAKTKLEMKASVQKMSELADTVQRLLA